MVVLFILLFDILSVNLLANSVLMAPLDALEAELRDSPVDSNSFARPDLARVKHIRWRAVVAFERQVIDGLVELTIDKQSDANNQLLLDSSGLTIFEVRDSETNQTLDYDISPPLKVFGSKITVWLPAKNRSVISIAYETSPNASALQWLTAEQTAGKRHPYLMSQCEAIHCRSLLPSQDTPAVKTPYEATIVVPKDLVVLLSAIKQDNGTLLADAKSKEYRFKQTHPIPSYLFAIAVGDLVSKRIGRRSLVWSEKELIERSAYEFADIEQMLTTAEEIAGPYKWDVYDVLVLPPSFPLGGMENPCVTFITPTILAGDRSLVNTIVHEIAHTWTGNLVTNANWGHFWLNEGFTTFLERKILGRLKGGEPLRQFRAGEGLKFLKTEIKSMGVDNPYTKLQIDTRGVDPDEAFTQVLYEKGHTFLYFLEQLLGGPKVFDPFLKSYISQFQFKSLTTDDFKKYLFEYFKDQKTVLERMDWNQWLNSTGMPPVLPQYDQTLSEMCTHLANRWLSADDSDLSNFTVKDIQSMDSWLVMDMFQLILDSDQGLSLNKIETMTLVYNLRSNNNSEVRSLWLQLCLKARWKGCVDDAIKFITSMGRMKFLKPIYRALYGWSETRQLAIDTFEANKHRMMHISAVVVAKELHLD